MSTATYGGRIVPILTGHQHADSTPESNLLENHPLSPLPSLPPQSMPIDQAALLDQRESTPVMRLKALDQQSLEMPCLKERGLFALPTEGDGNCLYYSLSDQLYGTFDHAGTIRQVLAAHMANHRKYFMQFVVAQGGERRRPKRAAVSAYATRSADVSAPSEEDKERQFEDMVASTRRNGEWGSSEHLQAFCQAFKVDINVYTMDGVQMFRDVYASHDEPRDVIHVAFHDFKHYSSVRVMDGCHTGLFVQSACRDIPSAQSKRPQEGSKDRILHDFKGEVLTKDAHIINTPPTSQNATSATDPHLTPNEPVTATDSGLAVDVFPPWDIQSIQDGLGGRYDRDTIVDMLQKCRGDIDRAFAALLGEKNEGITDKKVAPSTGFKSSLQVSRSSSPFSTGSKRSADDSDDSEGPRPAVRRGRPRRRLMPNLTLGVGIQFRDDQNEVVSLNLRVSLRRHGLQMTPHADRPTKQMKADAEKAENAEKAQKEQSESTSNTPDEAISEQPETVTRQGPRRSGRLSKTRPV
ncbi:uncharacterized protein N7459_002988 [Penicillium hispanicum]|uniref:uncharacterized protein n=1 Tax=Penicillium hispanicum TaxID=1080232 RepID=UPI00253F7A50|nr:uncharacterized protein N7459_002988 [Penicillium hispanicum]KAJ5587223.1 hypothetical protein N7459_002988 [Penicillium hispanicum]